MSPAQWATGALCAFLLASPLLARPDEIAGKGGTTAFTGLTDTPATYSGQANRILRVDPNSGEVGFSTCTLANDAMACPADANLGGVITLLPGVDDGPNGSWTLKLPDSGAGYVDPNAIIEHIIDPNGRLPSDIVEHPFSGFDPNATLEPTLGLEKCIEFEASDMHCPGGCAGRRILLDHGDFDTEVITFSTSADEEASITFKTPSNWQSNVNADTTIILSTIFANCTAFAPVCLTARLGTFSADAEIDSSSVLGGIIIDLGKLCFTSTGKRHQMIVATSSVGMAPNQLGAIQIFRRVDGTGCSGDDTMTGVVDLISVTLCQPITNFSDQGIP